MNVFNPFILDSFFGEKISHVYGCLGGAHMGPHSVSYKEHSETKLLIVLYQPHFSTAVKEKRKNFKKMFQNGKK